MVAITLNSFGGLSKKLSARMLPESMGVEVNNVDFSHGSLRPMASDSPISVTFSLGSPSGSSKTLYKTAQNKWFAFNNVVNVVESPVAEDQYDRVYFTGRGSYPEIAANQSINNIYKLAIPRPPKPSVALAPNPSLNVTTETPISRAYLATYVTAFGEEGPSSEVDPQDIIDVYTDQTVTVTVGSATGTRNYAYIRLYRTDEDGVFRFVHQGLSSGYSFADTVPDDRLGEEVPSRDWVGPPDGMIGLTAIPNGIVAGFEDQTVFFSEAYLPHAWPEEYRLTTKYPIVGIAPLDTGLLVLTKGKPSVVQGADPAGMVMTELDVAQSCVSQRSIVDMGSSVIYASPDGLVEISSSGASVVTDRLFTREQWQADYSPSSIRAFLWEDRYVAFSNTQSFIYDPRGGQASLTHIDSNHVAGFNDLASDSLYVINASGSVRTFAGASSWDTYDWESKHFFTQRPVNLGVVQVSFAQDLGAGDTTIVLYGGDGEPTTSLHTEVIPDTTDIATFRLPSGYKYNVYQITINGMREISALTAAESPQELR